MVVMIIVAVGAALIAPAMCYMRSQQLAKKAQVSPTSVEDLEATLAAAQEALAAARSDELRAEELEETLAAVRNRSVLAAERLVMLQAELESELRIADALEICANVEVVAPAAGIWESDGVNPSTESNEFCGDAMCNQGLQSVEVATPRHAVEAEESARRIVTAIDDTRRMARQLLLERRNATPRTTSRESPPATLAAARDLIIKEPLTPVLPSCGARQRRRPPPPRMQRASAMSAR